MSRFGPASRSGVEGEERRGTEAKRRWLARLSQGQNGESRWPQDARDAGLTRASRPKPLLAAKGMFLVRLRTDDSAQKACKGHLQNCLCFDEFIINLLLLEICKNKYYWYTLV